MASVVYRFTQGGVVRELLYEGVLSAAFSAIMDLHERQAEPAAICWQGRVLLDRPAVDRIYAACRPELVADVWHVPTALEAAARREVLQQRTARGISAE